MILEKALVKYNEKKEYDYTIESKFMNFETIKEIKTYINNNIEKDIEYFIYNSEKDIEKYECIESVICNNLL